MNPIWKKPWWRVTASCNLPALGQAERQRLLENVGLPALDRRDRDILVGMGRAHDDDGIDHSDSQSFRAGPGSASATSNSSAICAASPGLASANRGSGAFGNPRGEIARVDAAEPTESDQTDIESAAGAAVIALRFSSRHEPMRTVMSGGTGLSLQHLDRGLHRDPCPSRRETAPPSPPSSPPAAPASRPARRRSRATRILPVLPAAAMASIAPSAIMSLHANTVSIAGCACIMF